MTRATTTTTTTIRTTERHSAARLVVALVGFAWACSTPRPLERPALAAKPPSKPLHRGPTTDYVSAAGLRWLVLTKPREVLADPELGPAIAELVSKTRFDAFAESSGVDLRQVPRATIAGFAYGTLYLSELPEGAAANARERFAERLLNGALTKQPRPSLFRIAGIVGQTPETLVTVDDRLLAVAVGDPTPAKIVEAYAEERLKSSPSALHGSALSTLPDLANDNSAALLAPGPFADEWQAAAGGLLKSAVALGIAVRPLGNGRLSATVCVSGAWGETAEAAGTQLLSAWVTLAHSPSGELYGLNSDAHVQSDTQLLTLTVELSLARLVRGLKAAVLSDIGSILDLRPHPVSPDATPAVPPQ